MHTTAEPNPYWAVDLGVPLYIYGVKFTNRGYFGGMYAIYVVRSVSIEPEAWLDQV